MTKREFYENYKENPDISLGDIINLISEEDLYDIVEIKDSYSFDEWMYDEVREYLSYDGWRSLRDWLNTVEDTDYYVWYDGCFEGGISEDSIPYILNEIEDELEYRSDDWFNDIPDEEYEKIDTEINMLF